MICKKSGKRWKVSKHVRIPAEIRKGISAYWNRCKRLFTEVQKLKVYKDWKKTHPGPKYVVNEDLIVKVSENMAFYTIFDKEFRWKLVGQSLEAIAFYLLSSQFD